MGFGVCGEIERRLAGGRKVDIRPRLSLALHWDSQRCSDERRRRTIRGQVPTTTLPAPFCIPQSRSASDAAQFSKCLLAVYMTSPTSRPPICDSHCSLFPIRQTESQSKGERFPRLRDVFLSISSSIPRPSCWMKPLHGVSLGIWEKGSISTERSIVSCCVGQLGQVYAWPPYPYRTWMFTTHGSSHRRVHVPQLGRRS